MAKSPKRINLTSWWSSAVAVIIVGVLVFQYHDSFSQPSEAAVSINRPTISTCQPSIIPIRYYYLSNAGSDNDYTPQGVRRGGRTEPYRTISHAIEAAKMLKGTSYYPVKITIIDQEFVVSPEDLGAPGDLYINIPKTSQVWLTSESPQTRLMYQYVPPILPSININNYGKQLLIEKFLFDQIGLVVTNYGAGNNSGCKSTVRSNQFRATLPYTAEGRLMVTSVADGTFYGEYNHSTGTNVVTNNIIEVYDNPEDSNRMHSYGVTVSAAGASKTVLDKNTIIFPKYGTNKGEGGTVIRDYVGVQAHVWDSGRLIVSNNTFTTEEYDPDGPIDYITGIMYGSSSNIQLNNNYFSSFQGTPTIME